MKISFFPFSIQPKGRKRRGVLLTSSALILGSLFAGQEAEGQQSFQFPNQGRGVQTQSFGKSQSIFKSSAPAQLNTGSLNTRNHLNQGRPTNPLLGTQNTLQQPQQYQGIQKPFRTASRPVSNVNIRPNNIPTVSNKNVAQYRLRSIGSAAFISAMSSALGSHLKGKMINQDVAEIQLPAHVVPALPAAFGGNGQATTAQATMQIDRFRHTVKLTGHPSQVASWSKVVSAIDSQQYKAGIRRVIYVGAKDGRIVQNYLESNAVLENRDNGEFQYKLLAANGRKNADQFPGLATQTAFQQDNRPGQLPNTQQNSANQGGQNRLDQQQVQERSKPSQDLKIKIDPRTGIILLEGTERDIRLAKQLVKQFSQQSIANAPQTHMTRLSHANGQVVATQVQGLYDQTYADKFGPATIQVIQQPNAVLISGTKDAIQFIDKIVKELDVEVPVEGTFKIFHLRYAASTDVANRLGNFFATQVGAPGNNNNIGNTNNQNQGTGVIIIPDPRANMIIFKGGPVQIATAEKLVKEIDVIDIKSEKTVKIIPLKNSDAATMAQVLQNAIAGGINGEVNPTIQIGNQGFNNQGNQQVGADPSVAASLLKLRTIDPTTGKVTSGILNEVRIVPDPIGNTLVITAPEESIPLIEMLAKQLDRLPNAETQIKVFTIANGDGQQIFDMLQNLFLQNQNQQGGGGFGGFQNNTNTGLSRLPLQTGASDQSLVNLRFALEPRTNSIVASGSRGDLTVVEDLITHLDRSLSHRYQTKVLRLSNAPSEDTANTIRGWADGRLQMITNDPTTAGGTVTARRNVVIQEDVVHGHLIITASPEDMAEIEQIVSVLDRRPNMVAIEVVIAEVRLDDTEEFGLEYGIQDSLLFDRGIGSNIGFNFNQGGIGNDTTAASLATREAVGGQGLVNLNVGRVNSNLGYGGLVLSAGNESVSVLMRALKDRQRVRVLSRPQVMAIDLLQSRIQVGQRVPFLSSINNNTVGGVQSNVEFTDVGIILEVVPRVSPDGVITMLVNTTNSSLGNQADGIVVSTDAQGNAVRQPIINTTESISTVISRSGQTVVLGGLIRNSKSYSKRGIPILSDLPRVGNLFSFQSEVESRSELLIFMTPRIIDHDDALTEWNQTEMERMNWCTQDVLNLSNVGYSNQGRFDATAGPQVVYPSMDPTGQGTIPMQSTLEIAPTSQTSGGNQYPVSPSSVMLPMKQGPVTHAARATDLPAAKPIPEKPSLIKRTFQKVFSPSTTRKPTGNSGSTQQSK